MNHEMYNNKEQKNEKRNKRSKRRKWQQQLINYSAFEIGKTVDTNNVNQESLKWRDFENGLLCGCCIDYVA